MTEKTKKRVRQDRAVDAPGCSCNRHMMSDSISRRWSTASHRDTVPSSHRADVIRQRVDTVLLHLSQPSKARVQDE